MNSPEEGVENDTLPSPQMNVIKSVIDTLISKIASTKVRPFFTPINGDYTTVKVLKQLQIYFDDLYDRQDITRKISESYRDACIFDTGIIFINPFMLTIEKLCPWQATILDTEYQYGMLTKALITFNDFPETLLSAYGLSSAVRYSVLELYFDTKSKTITVYLNGTKEKTKSFAGNIPLVFLHYTNPVKGAKTTSITDDLYNTQRNIDLINARIKEASQLTPANLVMIPTTHNITPEMVDNRMGNIYRYSPTPGSGNPIEIVTPAFINQQYHQLLEYYIQKAYEMVGISQLSSQSVNPLGANASGAALQSMENIESTRFETQLNQVVRAYVDLAKILIEIIPEDEDILPMEANRSGYTWKDVKKQASLINIQYSAQTMLSKDPATRLQQIMQLSQIGVIPQSKIGRFLDQPDLNEVYSLATAAQDAVDKVIQLAIEEEYFTIPKFVSYQLLEETITAMQNQLLGAYTPENKEVLVSLVRIQHLDDMLQEIMIREGFTPVQPTGPIQVSEQGIGASGMVEAPSAVDAGTVPNNLGTPPEAANEKNQYGDIKNGV
jgi:hypothetical protein